MVRYAVATIAAMALQDQAIALKESSLEDTDHFECCISRREKFNVYKEM